MLETLSLMGMGFIHAMNPLTLVLMIGATALGITIGCLPGLSAAMGVALLLPVTFGMDQATGLIVLGGIYCGAIFGGSISAILIHTPGTPASAATAIEGYQMTDAQKYRMRLVRAHMDYITAEINDVDKMIENMISSFVLNIH